MHRGDRKMSLKGEFPRNFSIEKEYQEKYQDITNSGLFEGCENHDVFLVAMGYGWKNDIRKPVDERYPVVNTRKIDETQAWTLASIAIAEEGFSVLSDIDQVRKIAEEYANGGFSVLQDKIEQAPPNAELEKIQREMIQEIED